jgi:hypothetical protein
LEATPSPVSTLPAYRGEPGATVERDWVSWNRRFAAYVGLASLCLIAVTADGLAAARFANVALLALGLAALIGCIEAVRAGRAKPANRRRSRSQAGRVWVWAISVAAISAISSLTWFRPGMVVAGGDVPPPDGVAWISKLFVPWTWSGSDLGSPSALEQELPWATILWIVHSVGGSGELAQRLWFVAFFTAAAIACLALLRTLGIGPAASSIGALAYAFSPFVVANLIPNPVVLVAFALLPALPAIVLNAAKGRIGILNASLLIAISGPLLGWTYINPPTLGIVLAAIVAAPLIAGWIYGATGARRGLLVVAFGMALTMLVSLYWIVPAVLQLHQAAIAQLATVSGWSWTENRATIRNGLWLNTVWTWAYQEYFPFAPAYEVYPLSVLKFGPAIIAFAALALRFEKTLTNNHLLRMATVAATIALVLILLGTGTNPPGNALFDRLYALPLGWLLREPGRFLIVADLMFAVLVSITVQRLLHFDGLSFGAEIRGRFVLSALTILPLIVLVLVPGMPLMTGAIIPDNRGPLPSMHVRVPTYWIEMTSYMNQMPGPGGVLVMPPDDFYQMPYKWGYYGSDGFIGQLVKRPVLIPGQQVYFANSSQLLSIEELTTNSIISHDWQLESQLLGLLGTPWVLVRDDVDTTFGGRSIQSPSLLVDALREAGTFDLAHRSGPLWLFRLRGEQANEPAVAPYFATVNTLTPDLRVLSRLPDRAALVSGSSLAGVPTVEELPPVVDWQVTLNHVAWATRWYPDRSYALIDLNSEVAPQRVDSLVAGGSSRGPIHVSRVPEPDGTLALEVAIDARETLKNGNFHTGPWGPVGDCNNAFGAAATPSLSATVLPAGGPDGGPFLRLSAELGSACESQQLDWHGGPLLLNLSLRHVSGPTPRICVWESGPQRCAALAPAVAQGNQWTAFRAVVVPDSGTSALALFLYADGTSSKARSQADYGNVEALELASLPQLDVLATPARPSDSHQLEIHHSTYSTSWNGPSGSHHVLVDGIMNGWLAARGDPLVAEYSYGGAVRAGFVASVAGLLLIGALVAYSARTQRWNLALVTSAFVKTASKAVERTVRRLH